MKIVNKVKNLDKIMQRVSRKNLERQSAKNARAFQKVERQIATRIGDVVLNARDWL